MAVGFRQIPSSSAKYIYDEHRLVLGILFRTALDKQGQSFCIRFNNLRSNRSKVAPMALGFGYVSISAALLLLPMLVDSFGIKLAQTSLKQTLSRFFLSTFLFN